MLPSSQAASPANLSPCTGVCAMDRSGFCLGCARTLEEIGAWTVLPAVERLGILAKLAARKGTLAGDSPL